MSWRRILLLSLVFVLALCGATWIVLQRSDAATSLVERGLAERLATPATVATTEIDLAAGRLTVRGLEVEDPTRPGTALLRAERVELDAELDLGDLVGLRRVAITGLAIDVGATIPTAAQLLRPNPEPDGAGIPAVVVTGSRVRLGCVPGREPIVIENVDLSATPLSGERATLALRGSGKIAGLDASVTLQGHVDTATGAATVRATVVEWPLNNVCLEWLEQRLAIRARELDIAGQLQKLEIGFTGSRDAQGRYGTRLEARGSIGRARITGTGLPRHLRAADITFAASTDNDGEISLQITQATEQGEIDVTTTITDLAGEPDFSLRAVGKNLRVDDDAKDALRLFPVGSSIVDALQPESGRADVELFLRNPWQRDGIAEFDMTVRDGVLAYHGYGDSEQRIGFPLPLVNASGIVRLRDDIVELDEMSANIAERAGGGAVTLSGRINTLADPEESTTLDIGVTGVAFTDDLRAALADVLDDDGALYDRLDPEGRADVDVAVRPASQLAGSFLVTVRPRGATVEWKGFPYRLDELGGVIVVRAAGAEFDLEGRHGDGTVALAGRIPIVDAPDVGSEGAGLEVAVELTNLRVDPDLRVAVAEVAPAIIDAWENCAPSGRCSGFVRVWQSTPQDELHFDLRIDVDGVDLDLPAKPWRALGLSGKLLIAGSGEQARIDFDSLRGRLEHGDGSPARLAMLGRVVYGGPDDSDVSLVVRGLELDEQLGRTLTEEGALGPGVWDYLRPSGSVDLVCRHRLTSADDALSLVVHLLDVGSDAPILPQPARKMTGELHVSAGRTTFEELRADLGGNLVRCLDGSISTAPAPDGRTLIAFTVKAADFPLDGRLAAMFPGPLKQTIAERELAGTADIDGLRLSFAVPAAGSTMPFETVIGGELRLQDVGLTLGAGKEGFRVDRLYGNVRLDESRIGDAGGRLVGSLDNTSLRLLGQPFEGLSGRFAAGPRRMKLEELQGRFHGGVLKQRDAVAPAFVYTLPAPETPDGRLQASLAFEGVDVHSFLLVAGWVSPPYRGAARGHLVLERLDGHDVVDASGSGALAIERGDLGVVPLFTAIYSQLPAPERPRFDKLDAVLRLGDRRVVFDRLVLRSNLLEAAGNGTLDLDGYVNVRLTLDNLLGNTADPIFAPFINFFSNIVRFHLFGHIRDLKAEGRWITESSPRRPPVPPLPPVTEPRKVADY